MRSIHIAAMLAILVAVNASAQVPLTDPSGSVTDDTGQGTDLGAIAVGSVVATGTLANGVCTFAPGKGYVDGDGDGGFIGGVLDLDEATCELKLGARCVTADECPRVYARSAAWLAYPVLDVQPQTRNGPDTPSAGCASERRILSDLWTEGYAYDPLTEVWSKMRWSYNCSNGVAKMNDVPAKCEWLSGNNWHNDYCYWVNPPPCCSGVQIGVKGGFHCEPNGNFCQNRSWTHWLQETQFGSNNGSYSCGFNWGGDVPPHQPWVCRSA